MRTKLAALCCSFRSRLYSTGVWPTLGRGGEIDLWTPGSGLYAGSHRLSKTVAWILLVVGILFAGLLVVLGAVQESVGAPSPVLENVPVLNLASNLPGGILTGLGVLFLALILFLLCYAASEVIRLALSIEQSSREAALYLRGESLLPSSAAARVVERHARIRARKELRSGARVITIGPAGLLLRRGLQIISRTRISKKVLRVGREQDHGRVGAHCPYPR